MTGFIAHLYNLLLHFTNHYMTHYIFSSPSSSTVASRDSLNLLLQLPCISLPSLLSDLRLPTPETPSVLIIPAFNPRYIASDRLQQRTPFPNNSSVVIEVCLPHCCIGTVVLLLLRACSFPRGPVY
jgi:hypothetical protein